MTPATARRARRLKRVRALQRRHHALLHPVVPRSVPVAPVRAVEAPPSGLDLLGALARLATSGPLGVMYMPRAFRDVPEAGLPFRDVPCEPGEHAYERVDLADGRAVIIVDDALPRLCPHGRAWGALCPYCAGGATGGGEG